MTQPQPPDLAELAAAAKEATLNKAWKELIAEALRRNVVVAVGKHRTAVEAAVLAAGLAEGRSEREALDVERLALAIHNSSDHPNLPGCLDMDRDTAGYLAAEYAAYAAHPTPPDSIDDTQRAEEAGR